MHRCGAEDVARQDSTRLTDSHHLLRILAAAWTTVARALLKMLRMTLILNRFGLDSFVISD